MATVEALKIIVKNGSNLTLADGFPENSLNEILELAKSSGARITLSTSMRQELMIEISKKYGNTVSFIDGLDVFKIKK